MTTASLTLPEAKATLSGVVRRFNVLAAHIIEPVARGSFPDDGDDIYLKIVALLQALDAYIEALRDPAPMPAEDWADLCQTAHAVRAAAYLIICNSKPDQAWYWTSEHQQRIRRSDTELTPEVRQRVLADVRTTYAVLTEESAELAALQAEDRVYDASVADGLACD
jgi:hypothetical protein